MENKKLIFSLIGIIIILSLTILYFLIIQPSLANRDLNNQKTGYQIAIDNLLTILQQNGYVSINVGNQTIYLVQTQPQETGQ